MHKAILVENSVRFLVGDRLIFLGCIGATLQQAPKAHDNPLNLDRMAKPELWKKVWCGVMDWPMTAD
jgi:hypothetical protein